MLRDFNVKGQQGRDFFIEVALIWISILARNGSAEWYICLKHAAFNITIHLLMD